MIPIQGRAVIRCNHGHESASPRSAALGPGSPGQPRLAHGDYIGTLSHYCRTDRSQGRVVQWYPICAAAHGLPPAETAPAPRESPW